MGWKTEEKADEMEVETKKISYFVLIDTMQFHALFPFKQSQQLSFETRFDIYITLFSLCRLSLIHPTKVAG